MTERQSTADPPKRCRCRQTTTRRRLLGGVVGAGVAALAGCLGDDGEQETPDAITLDGNKQCDVCGMIIEEGFGPNGQVFFDGEYPAARDGPAWYDSVRELFTDRFSVENRHEPIVTYVTDYSEVEYSIGETDGTRYISGPVSAESFVAAEDAAYVIESGIEGVMGPDLLPFSEAADGQAFVDEHGGTLLEYDDITSEIINSL